MTGLTKNNILITYITKYKMNTDNPFDGLGIRYPQAICSDGSIKREAFFENESDESTLIPFEDRIKILAELVFKGHDLHELVENYLNDASNDDTRKDCIARTFKAYANEIFFKSENEDWRNDIVEVLIGDEDKTASEQMREAINTFIEVVNIYLKKEDFIKPPKAPVHLFRTIFEQKDAYKNIDKLIEDLYENNILSINVKDKKGDDSKYIDALLNGNKEYDEETPDYIKQFCKIAEELKNSDVIIIAHYDKKNPKIGLIKKGSTCLCEDGKEVGEVYKLYYFQMRNACRVSDNSKKFLDTIIPVRKTISPIIKGADVVRSIYYGMPLPFELTSLSNSNLEKLCAEYLRSCLSYKSIKVLGKNYPAIDIFGYDTENKLFVAQVTAAGSSQTIENKKEKLCSFVKAKKIMFSTNPTVVNSDPSNYNIQEVWDYFVKNDKKLLERLIEM